MLRHVEGAIQLVAPRVRVRGTLEAKRVIVVEKQGAVVVAYVPYYSAQRREKISKRGAVTEFSQKSRRRLLLLANRLEEDVRTSFLTLTFHGSPTISQSNVAFKRFRTIMGRMFPNASAIWRREFQPGRGAVHFHLLVFHLPYWKQKDIQTTWTRCTGEDRSIVHITLLRGRSAATRYVAKYMAKVPEEAAVTSLDVAPYQHNEGKPSLGRAWGYINKACLPLAETTVLAVMDEEMVENLWAVSWWFTGGRCGNNPDTTIFFSEDAGRIVRWLKEMSATWATMPPDVAKICKPSLGSETHPVIECLFEVA